MAKIIFFFLSLWCVSGVFAGDAVKSVSVTEGESVTLVIEVTTDNEIQWIFGHNNKNILIALFNRQSRKKTVYDDALDGRFRDRLKLDQTGSLTITDTRTTDSGLYEVKISSSTQTPLNTFNLTVYDSSGKRVNESVSVEMQPLLNKEVPDGVNESVSAELPLLDE